MSSSPSTASPSTEDGNLSAALDTVPKPATIGDPNPLTIRDVKRDGPRMCWSTWSSPDAAERQSVRRRPDAGLGAADSDAGRAQPTRRQAIFFELDGLPPGAKPDGAALKFTLVGA